MTQVVYGVRVENWDNMSQAEYLLLRSTKEFTACLNAYLEYCDGDIEKAEDCADIDFFAKPNWTPDSFAYGSIKDIFVNAWNKVTKPAPVLGCMDW